MDLSLCEQQFGSASLCNIAKANMGNFKRCATFWGYAPFKIYVKLFFGVYIYLKSTPYSKEHTNKKYEILFSGINGNLSQRAEMQRAQLNNYCNNTISRLDIDVLARLCTALECDIM